MFKEFIDLSKGWIHGSKETKIEVRDAKNSELEIPSFTLTMIEVNPHIKTYVRALHVGRKPFSSRKL
jgi:hypothetical protein